MTKDAFPSGALLFTPEQAAEVMSTGRTTVFRLMRTGELASVKIGRSRRIPRAAVEAYVAKLIADSGSSAA